MLDNASINKPQLYNIFLYVKDFFFLNDEHKSCLVFIPQKPTDNIINSPMTNTISRHITRYKTVL